MSESEKYIIRAEASDDIEKLLRSPEDFEIITPLEEFDDQDDGVNMIEYEIITEKNFEKPKKKDIIKDTIKSKETEKKQDGKSNDTELERH